MTGFHRKRRRTRGGANADTNATTGHPPADDAVVVRPSPPPARRRPRVGSPADVAAAVGAAATTADIADSDAGEATDNRPRPPVSGPPPEDREAERGLRGLVGSGTSQVGVGAALRARDAARPTDEDLAAAETELTIVRRHWVPRDDGRWVGGGARGDSGSGAPGRPGR